MIYNKFDLNLNIDTCFFLNKMCLRSIKCNFKVDSTAENFYYILFIFGVNNSFLKFYFGEILNT